MRAGDRVRFSFARGLLVALMELTPMQVPVRRHDPMFPPVAALEVGLPTPSLGWRSRALR